MSWVFCLWEILRIWGEVNKKIKTLPSTCIVFTTQVQRFPGQKGTNVCYHTKHFFWMWSSFPHWFVSSHILYVTITKLRRKDERGFKLIIIKLTSINEMPSIFGQGDMCSTVIVLPLSEKASEGFWLFGIIQRPHSWFIIGLDNNLCIAYIFPFLPGQSRPVASYFIS